MIIIEHLVTFGSIALVSAMRKYQNEIRALENYKVIEGGIDRGLEIRETSAFIVNLLINIKELEDIRNNGRRLKEKYTGISSGYSENPIKYKSNDSNYKELSSIKYPTSLPLYSNNIPSTLKKPDNIFTHDNTYMGKNKKNTESISYEFVNNIYIPPNYMHANNPEKNLSEKSDSISSVSNNSISNQRKPLNNINEKPVVPDIFLMDSTKEVDVSKPIHSYPINSSLKESKNTTENTMRISPSLYASIIRTDVHETTKEKSSIPVEEKKESLVINDEKQHTDVNKINPSIQIKDNLVVIKNSYIDIFLTGDQSNNNNKKFESGALSNDTCATNKNTAEMHPPCINNLSSLKEEPTKLDKISSSLNKQNSNEQKTNNLFKEMSQKRNNEPIEENKITSPLNKLNSNEPKTNNLFKGMTQKRNTKPTEENKMNLEDIVIISNKTEKQENQEWDLESLNLYMPTEKNTIPSINSSTLKINQIGYNKDIPKVKINLIQSEPIPQVIIQPKKKFFTSDELEKKLFTFEI